MKMQPFLHFSDKCMTSDDVEMHCGICEIVYHLYFCFSE